MAGCRVEVCQITLSTDMMSLISATCICQTFVKAVVPLESQYLVNVFQVLLNFIKCLATYAY